MNPTLAVHDEAFTTISTWCEHYSTPSSKTAISLTKWPIRNTNSDDAHEGQTD